MKQEETKREKQDEKKTEAVAELGIDTDKTGGDEGKVAKLHVGRLSRNVNKDHLIEIFGNYGAVKAVDVIIVCSLLIEVLSYGPGQIH